MLPNKYSTMRCKENNILMMYTVEKCMKHIQGQYTQKLPSKIPNPSENPNAEIPPPTENSPTKSRMPVTNYVSHKQAKPHRKLTEHKSEIRIRNPHPSLTLH